MTRRFLLICICWTLLTLVAGLIGVWRIHSHPIEGVSSELRASKLGLSMGALTATGYALVWLMTALTARRMKTHPSRKNEPLKDKNFGTSRKEDTSL